MLRIVLSKLKQGPSGLTVDTYYGSDDELSFRVYVPKGERLTSIDVHFEVEDEDDGSNDIS